MTFGGALFAAFPEAYATVFSGFYTAFMLLLFALIFRAVSMEFRSKVESQGWRRFWDWGFFGGSARRHAPLRRRGRQRHDRHAARRRRQLHRHPPRPARALSRSWWD